MLKASAQTPSMVAAGALALGAPLAAAVGGPFVWFFAVFLATGSLACAAATAVASHRRRTAGVALSIFGGLLVVVGVLLFAPQPLWVGSVLIAVGTLQVARAES